MHRNYFTLYHAARELDTLLAGGYLFEVFSQEKMKSVYRASVKTVHTCNCWS